MPPFASTAPATTRPLSSLKGVLFALSNEERRLFFPGDALRKCPSAQHVDVRGMGKETWNNLLDEQQPSVLVTSWSTPSLDPARTTVHGGSIDYICHVVGSVRHIVSHELINEGLKVTNWGSLIAPQVAEHALLTILALLRNLGLWRELMLDPVENSQQRLRLATRTLHGKTVAIHGFGMIARELIRLLRPFDTTIRVFSAGVPDALIREHQATPVSSLLKLAEGVDVFVTCEALTPATQKSINAKILNAIPPGAVFVNVGRGAVVDEQALAEIAKARNLRVGSDVFSFEPLPVDSPLFELPGALLSPHIAGPTLDSYAACGQHALANIDNYFSGRPLIGPMTSEIFARST